jgi:hypothetical protein
MLMEHVRVCLNVALVRCEGELFRRRTERRPATSEPRAKCCAQVRAKPRSENVPSAMAVKQDDASPNESEVGNNEPNSRIEHSHRDEGDIMCSPRS